MREASSLVLAARLQGEGATVRGYDPVAERRARASCCRASSSADSRRGGARGRRRGDPGHRVAGVRRARLAGARERMATPLVVDGRNFLDPERAARGGLRLRGHRAPGVRRPTGRSGRAGALMQALVLVGGEGTRLRPLTLTPARSRPFTLVDRPFIRYMVDWLGRHGVDDVVMACGFRRRGPASGARRRPEAAARISLRRGARAARHRRAAPPRRRRGAARRALPGPERRRPHRSRPGGAACALHAEHRRRGHPRASTRSTTRASYGARAAADAAAARSLGSSRSPTRPRSTPTRSTPAPT